MTKIAQSCSLAAVLACAMYVAPAQAQRARTFVASYGTDSGNTICSFTQPCRTFQAAVNAVAAGGEVTAVDSAGFSSINITKAVTITSPAGVEAGIVSGSPSTPAITISAGSADLVSLRGLTLDGASTTANGIVFNSGEALEIIDCMVRNFTGDGIDLNPNEITTRFLLLNTRVLHNNGDGISIFPQADVDVIAVLDHVVMSNNRLDGLLVDDTFTTRSINATVSESVIANNKAFGINASSDGASLNVMLRNSSIVNNGSIALMASGGSTTIWVGRSSITGNGVSAEVANNGNIFSFGDNNIINNTINALPFTTPLH